MRTYNVNRVTHKVYDDGDPIPERLVIQSDWRNGQVGDWVKADDNCIIQVLRRGSMLKAKGSNRIREYIGTCTGTFPVSTIVKMDTSRRTNIYSFGGGKKSDDILLDRTKLSGCEHLFVLYLASGLGATDAYLKAFPTSNPNYAKVKSGQLVKTERIRTAMKEELKPVMEELGIDEKSVLSGIKEIADTSIKEETRLKALFKLGDIMDLEDKNQTKITQISGTVFKGFTEDLVESAERPEIEE